MTEPSVDIAEFTFATDVINAQSLRSALSRREKKGASVPVNLVLVGAIASSDLLRYLTEMAGYTRIGDERLSELDEKTLSLLPAELVYDTGTLPVLAEEGAMVVATADPTNALVLDDLRLVTAGRIKPLVMSLRQLAVHYPTLAGRLWQVEESDLLPETQSLTDEVSGAIQLAFKLNLALDEACAEKVEQFVIRIPQKDAEDVRIELSRSKRTAAATLDKAGGPTLTAAERPRVANKSRGSSKHYLDPVVEGETVIVESAAKGRDAEEPKIIIDMGMLEDDSPKKKSENSTIFIDPSLLEPTPPGPPQSGTARIEDAATEIWETVSTDDLDDFDDLLMPGDNSQAESPANPKGTQEAHTSFEVKIGAVSNVDSSSGPEDEWERLGAELDALESGLEDLEWPFDNLDVMSGEFDLRSTEFAVIDLDEPAPKVKESAPKDKKVVPLAGEATSDFERSEATPPKWFDPFSEPATLVETNPKLWAALREMRVAENRREAFSALAEAISSVYERSAVMRIEGNKVRAMAYTTPRSGLKWVDSEDAPTMTVTQFPALAQLIDDGRWCFDGRIPGPATQTFRQALAGGPALGSIICPIALGPRIVMLLHADGGPGREPKRNAELWKLLLREVPRTLLRLLLMRKRVNRWDVKG